MGRYNRSPPVDATIMASKNRPIICEHAAITFATQQVNTATARPAKNILDYSFRAYNSKVPKAVIKGVFSRLYCCYGDLFCRENDNNVFTNDWAVF